MIPLTEHERWVLGEIEFEPDRPIEKIADSIRMKPATVTSIFRGLEKRGAIQRQAFVDPYKLGYQDIGIFFRSGMISEELRTTILNKLTVHENVVWFGALAGEYQFGISLLIRDISDLQSFIDDIGIICPAFFNSKVIAFRTRTTIYPRKYLCIGSPSSRRLTFVRPALPVEVDAIDQRLLSIASRLPYRSLRDISRTAEVPLATVERRLRRLSEAGVYHGIFYAVHQTVLGVTYYRILLSLKGTTPDKRRQFEDFCSHHPNITFLVESIGTWDFEVGCEVSETWRLPQILEEISNALRGSLLEANTLTEVKDFKFVMFPFGSA